MPGMKYSDLNDVYAGIKGGRESDLQPVAGPTAACTECASVLFGKYNSARPQDVRPGDG